MLRLPFATPHCGARPQRSGIGYESLRRDYRAAQKSGQVWIKEAELPSEEPYFVKFFPTIANYKPADYWRLIHVPVLVVEAGQDERIPIGPSVEAIQQALRENRNPDFTIIVPKRFPSFSR